MIERLWAPWRATYLDALDAAPTADDPAAASPGTGLASDGTDPAAPQGSAAGPIPSDGGRSDHSLFERILHSGLADEETYIVWRGVRCFALLNLYPYTSGHLLVLPNQAVRNLEDLDEETSGELWQAVRRAVVATKAAYRPDGINIGANLGTAAGAGVPDHLHIHVLARWFGDTNFTTAVAETRIMPEPLDLTWRKLRAAWPAG